VDFGFLLNTNMAHSFSSSCHSFSSCLNSARRNQKASPPVLRFASGVAVRAGTHARTRECSPVAVVP
jgi:hypothetical protein